METEERRVNVNIGVLGHVDSGKTSICKLLSTTASTASFDNNPQSKERGITLDLGFSAFNLEEKFNVTLVDCPGHASLIRTVLGGVQIMDMMILVIDIKKGMQAQSAECLILADIVCPHIIVVLNKVDSIEKRLREEKIEKVKKQMRSALDKMRFIGEPIVVTSAIDTTIGVDELKDAILAKVKSITFKRDIQSHFLFAVDHCFNIKGSGTVCTGTVLQGKVKIGDTVEFPALQTSKKVKSMQIFREPVSEAMAGDRVALGISGLDSSQIERGLIAAPSTIPPPSRLAIVAIRRIPFYKETLSSQRRYHISLGYSTVTAMTTLFSSTEEVGSEDFDKNNHYNLEDTIEPSKHNGHSSKKKKRYYAILEFDKPLSVLPNALIIGSNLQLVETTTCRFAFHGHVIEAIQDKEYHKTYLPTLNLFSWKKKSGTIDRVSSRDKVIVKGFCQKQSNIDHLVGLKVSLTGLKEPIASTSTGEDNKQDKITPVQDPNAIQGRIESRFGQTNKLRVNLDRDLTDEENEILKNNVGKVDVQLIYKKYLWKEKNNAKKLSQ